MDVFIRALPLCDSLRYATSEVLIGVLHVRNNHSLTHIHSGVSRISARGVLKVGNPMFQKQIVIPWLDR